MGCYVKNDWSGKKLMILINTCFLNKEREVELVIDQRYSEASKNKHILYRDINNLYGHAMSQYLPYPNFKCIENIDKIEQK